MVVRGNILCVIGKMLRGTEDQTHIAYVKQISKKPLVAPEISD